MQDVQGAPLADPCNALETNPGQVPREEVEEDEALLAPIFTAHQSGAHALACSPTSGAEHAQRPSRHGPRPETPGIQELITVLQKLLNCPEKEKAVIGPRASLLSQRVAGSSIDAQDLDIVSISEKLLAADMPIVTFIMQAHGAFTPRGMLSMKSTLTRMKLAYAA